MKTRDYEAVLNALDTTGVYVIREDNHEIQYFNQRVKEIAPDIRKGAICHELWTGPCSDCPLPGASEKKSNRTTNYNGPFGKATDLTATRILWEDEIPAFVVTVRQHEESVEELELKSAAILKSMGEVNFGVYLLDPHTGYMNSVRVDEADKDFLDGVNMVWDEVLESLLQRRYHQDYWEKIRTLFTMDALREAMRAGKEKVEIIALRNLKGQYRYISACAYFYKNEKNQNYIVMAFQDADTRIRGEIKRSQNDQRMAAIIESRYSTMNTVHLESGICERTYLRNSQNNGETRIGDYEFYIERAVREYICEEDRERFLSMFSLENLRKKAAEVQDFAEIVCEYRFKAPRITWVQEHLFFMRQENSMVVNILGRDITHRKLREEKENREAREKAYIINSLSSMFFATYYVDLTNATYRTVIQREDVGKILGERRSYTEAIRLYAQKFILPENQEEYLQTMEYGRLQEQLSPEHPFIAIEYRKQADENGKIGWVRATVVLAETENGMPKTALYVAQDITESKEKEERERRTLKDACDAANHANASKSEFLSRMSHDIRTPMNAIIGMTAIAGTHLNDKERVADCLSKITVSSKHLLSLINEVLDMSKIESGKIDLAEEEFNLSDLVENVMTIIQPSVKAKNHQLEARISKVEHEAVIGDVMRLQQVFTNILSNAVKYTPNGGRLEIEIMEKQSKAYGYGCYEFVFSDNGIGMSEDFQKQIFEPFARAEDSRVSKVEGTGLGMTIAQNIVRMMNGSIRVDSRVNQGTRFTVTLFLKQQNTSALDVKEFENLRVLVADDDESACETACVVLKDIGMEGEWVLSGEEAIQKVLEARQAEKQFFAVILDWKMPGMDGIETARKIRRLVGPDVPIIILSAYDWSDVEEEARRAGVDGFISKPLFKSRLVYLFKQLSGDAAYKDENTEESLAARNFEGKRILLVEDNDLNREIAEEMIGMSGAVIESAVNGQEGVELFKEKGEGYYNLIFMDIQMPVMNGYDAARAIRKINRPDAGTIPIIAMTANAFAEDVQASKKAGMNEHITKPLDFNKLLRCMDEWL